MRHLGDITKIHGNEVPIVDVIVGGSPCQDLSVAGKRAGLEGERSGLFMDQVRIVKEMRNESKRQLSTQGTDYDIRRIRPRFMVWENVAGAFSSGNPKGADFKAVLEEIVKVVVKDIPDIPIPKDGWPYAGCIEGVGDDGVPFSVCYRLHDAQYWGVPNVERESHLSQILEEHPLPKYSLSPQACQGILRRADRRNKQLPSLLKEVLMKQSRFKSEEANLGGVKESSFKETEQELSQHSTIKPYCIQGGGKTSLNSNGSGYSEDVSYTLNSVDNHAVCYDGSQISPTLTANNAGGNQRMPDKGNFNAVIAFDRAAFNQGENAKYDFSIQEDTAQTIVSRGPGGGYDSTVGALCARDYKGVGNQYVSDGKCIIQPSES